MKKQKSSKHTVITSKSGETSQNKSQLQSGERIQKVLSRAGLGSRREIERWITEGKIRINEKPSKLGDRIVPGDQVKVNGRRVDLDKFSEQAPRVLIYYKPTGEVVTRRDPEGRPVIFTQLPKLAVGRWITVGRLDINTQGLLLVTNHGELAHRLMHPSTEIIREYAVRVFGKVTNEIIERLKSGVDLEDGMAHFDSITFAGGEGINRWYKVTVTEGRNRLIRRLWESQELVVNRLMRVRYGPVYLPEKLKARLFYELNDKELQVLFDHVSLKQQNRVDLNKKSTRSKVRPRS
ncbi:MAG TPA: pseudouridine synthase [Methylococcaceae bacterium]|nr:pseudouridine synthase [Methylococcaceae bacterium]HIL39955.1 pseudouridine synthase [Methylococcales bacterium]